MMKKINWKLRLKNKTTLISIIVAIATFIYQLAGIFGIADPIGDSASDQLAGIVANLILALGVIVDPTTKGVSDSERAMGYEKPRGDE